MFIGILGEAGSGKDTAGRFLVQEHGFYSLALADPIKVYCHWMFGWDAQQLWGDSGKRNEADPRYPFYRCPSCGRQRPTQPSMNTPTASRVACVRPYVHLKSGQGDLSPRYALQSLGDWTRALFKDAYLDFTLRRAKVCMSMGIFCDPLWDVIPPEVLKERLTERAYKGASRHVSETTKKISRFSDTSNILISDVRFKNEIEGIQAANGRVYRIRRQSFDDTTTSGIPQHNSEVEQREVDDEDLDGVIENDGTLLALQKQMNDLVANP